jgi:hypothetical protein
VADAAGDDARFTDGTIEVFHKGQRMQNGLDRAFANPLQQHLQ